MHICALTASDAGADLILSAVVAGRNVWDARRALRQVGRPAVSVLIRALSSSNRNVRAVAIDVLGDLRDTDASEGLLGLLDSSSDHHEVRQIMFALAKIGDNRARAPLLVIKKRDGGGLEIAQAFLDLGDSAAAADTLLDLLASSFHSYKSAHWERQNDHRSTFNAAAKMLANLDLKIDDIQLQESFSLLLRTADEYGFAEPSAEVLQFLWEGRTFDQLVEAALNENRDVRAIALNRLREHVDDERLPAVCRILRSLTLPTRAGKASKTQEEVAAFS